MHRTNIIRVNKLSQFFFLYQACSLTNYSRPNTLLRQCVTSETIPSIKQKKGKLLLVFSETMEIFFYGLAKQWELFLGFSETKGTFPRV